MPSPVTKIHRYLQKVHQFQQSVEEVMHRLSEAERNGGFLSDQGVSAKTETDINDFRNQLKASSSFDPSPFLLSNPSNFTSYCIILGTPLPSHWWLTREASGLAVSYVDQSDADTRLVAMAKTCSPGFNLHQMLMQILFLQGKTCALGFN